MSRMNYIFGDLKTGRIIAEIPMFGVTISGVLNSYGEFGGSYQLDMTGQRNEDLRDASIPGRCYLVAELDGQPIFGGMVWSRTYQAAAKTFQIYCKSFEYYPFRRFIRESLAFGDDQTAIFISLWNNMQGKPDGNLLVEGDQLSNIYSTPTGVSKSLKVEAKEYKTYGQIMEVLSDGHNGFDWTIDITRDANTYRRLIRIGYPQIGAPHSDRCPVLEFPGHITNYWATESLSDAGTHIDLIGAGEGDVMLTSQFIHEDLLNTGMIEFDIDVPYKDVTSQNVLDDLAISEGANRRSPATVIKVEIKTDLDPVFGSYGLGDCLHLVINDPRYNKFDFHKRLIKWDFWPPSQENTQHAIITFEGDEI